MSVNIKKWLLRWPWWQKQEHACKDLLPSQQVLSHLDLSQRRDLGLQEVRLVQIVGSSGRAQQFDLDFSPRRSSGNGRWLRIARARKAQAVLPPILLLKVGNKFLVEDGNHRISVARFRGESTILARVMELDTTQLREEKSCTRLGYKV